MLVRVLSEEECLAVLRDNRLGHLACCRDGQPYMVPIYYAHAGNGLYSFSMPGRKVESMRANPKVAMLVEQRGRGREWKSVLAEGRYEELPDRIGYKQEREHAWSLLSRHADWWEPGGLRPVVSGRPDHGAPLFFRIAIDSLSGREAKEE